MCVHGLIAACMRVRVQLLPGGLLPCCVGGTAELIQSSCSQSKILGLKDLGTACVEFCSLF